MPRNTTQQLQTGTLAPAMPTRRRRKARRNRSRSTAGAGIGETMTMPTAAGRLSLASDVNTLCVEIAGFINGYARHAGLSPQQLTTQVRQQMSRW